MCGYCRRFCPAIAILLQESDFDLMIEGSKECLVRMNREGVYEVNRFPKEWLGVNKHQRVVGKLAGVLEKIVGGSFRSPIRLGLGCLLYSYHPGRGSGLETWLPLDRETLTASRTRVVHSDQHPPKRLLFCCRKN